MYDSFPVFVGFTENAIAAINLAEREAAELGSGYVGAEHVLLGLLCHERGLGGQVLLSLGFSADGVRRQLQTLNDAAHQDAEDMPAPGRFERHSRTPVAFEFTPRGRAVLERAVSEALILGSGSIGTEHLLPGLSRQAGSLAMRALYELMMRSHAVTKRHSTANSTWNSGTR